MRENGIVSRIRTGRGGRVHELKSGKEEGEKKKVSSPFHPQDPIENSLLLPRCISLKIRGKGLVLLQNDILRLIRLTVLMTCLQDKKLEPQGASTGTSVKNCKTVFPQTSGYLKYRSKGKGGGALLRRMVLNRGRLLLISCSDSTAAEA